MRNAVRVVSACVLFLAAGHVVADQQTAEETAPGFVVICPITGMVDDGMAVLVDRAVKMAAGAKAIIFEVDTPGGRVDSAIEITKRILNAPCRTIAYIQGMGAISAGAIISYACQDMVMAPDTNIGAAAPVTITSDGMLPTSEKEVSFVRGKVRALAERNGHNPDIAEAMVDKDLELRVVPKDGKPFVYAIRYPGASHPGEARPSASTPDSVERILRLINGEPPMPIPGTESPKPRKPKEELSAPPAVPRATTPAPADGSEVVMPPGKLLTLTPKDALRFGVIRATVTDLDQVMAMFDCAGLRKAFVEMTWSEALYRWLTNPIVAGILLTLGVGAIYFEIKNPGLTLPGVVGVTCLFLFFGARAVIGLSGWIDILLVFVGLVLVLVEIFVFPGHGLLAAAGIVSMLVGIYLSLTRVPIPEYSWDYDRLADAGTTTAIALVSLTLLVVAFWKLFPRSPAYRFIVQTHEQMPDKGYVVQTAAEHDAVIGHDGVALSTLRPAGRGRFGEKTYSVVTRGDFLEPGTPIQVVAVDGNRYVVDPVAKPKEA